MPRKDRRLERIIRRNYKGFSKLLFAFLLVFVFTFLLVSIIIQEDKPAPRVQIIAETEKVEIEVLDVSSMEELIDEVIVEEIEPEQEQLYGLYEEDLPEDVVETPKVIKVEKEFALLAIVIDDMGISHKRTGEISEISAPLTASFLTYGTDLKRQVEGARASGHEIIVHIPMEAKTNKETAPDVLTTKMSAEEIQANLKKMLDKFESFEIKGCNNHMGSLFTEDKKSMEAVMEVLKERGMFFLDSKTSSKSVGEKVAHKQGVPVVRRQVFLDNENNLEYILGQLKIAEKSAKKNGVAIAIGHPKSQTIKALQEWIPTLEEKGIKLVHLSEIVKLQNP